MSGTTVTSAWRRFWEKGGWWRALVLVVAYYVLYQLGSIAISSLIPATHDPAAVVWSYTALPIAWGGVLLVLFAWSTGWLRELFGPQPIRGRGWMWIAVVVVVLFNALRFATIDYGKAGAGVVVAWIVAGLFIGFAEEVLTRGFVVNLMRKGGHREITVALVSAVLFSGLHAGNLLTGQDLLPTLAQLFYTFAFGVCMYLSLRVTGNLLWPILLHATTDPSVFLQTTYPADGSLTVIAAQSNVAVILTGLVLVFFIRGKVGAPVTPVR